MKPLTEAARETIRWNEQGLIAAIVQDATTKDVLMMAWMNRDALDATIQRGKAVFWSRSRQKLWQKGETSGNVQHIVDIRIDCDADTLLLLVHADGPACHTNAPNCFYRSIDEFNENPKRD